MVLLGDFSGGKIVELRIRISQQTIRHSMGGLFTSVVHLATVCVCVWGGLDKWMCKKTPEQILY